jgi:hypothetical protein
LDSGAVLGNKQNSGTGLTAQSTAAGFTTGTILDVRVGASGAMMCSLAGVS